MTIPTTTVITADMRDHGGGEIPGAFFVALGQKTAENRDERRSERARHHDHEEQIRHPERADIGVVFAGRAEPVAQNHLAQKPKHAADDKSEADDRGAAPRGVDRRRDR